MWVRDERLAGAGAALDAPSVAETSTPSPISHTLAQEGRPGASLELVGLDAWAPRGAGLSGVTNQASSPHPLRCGDRASRWARPVPSGLEV